MLLFFMSCSQHKNNPSKCINERLADIGYFDKDSITRFAAYDYRMDVEKVFTPQELKEYKGVKKYNLYYERYTMPINQVFTSSPSMEGDTLNKNRVLTIEYFIGTSKIECCLGSWLCRSDEIALNSLRECISFNNVIVKISIDKGFKSKETFLSNIINDIIYEYADNCTCK